MSSKSPQNSKAQKQHFSFFNRELGWLYFNERILKQASNSNIPLLERLKFINIYFSNLDEFFMKRVGGLKRQFISQTAAKSDDGSTPEEQLILIREQAQKMNSEMARVINESILPELEESRIFLKKWKNLKTSQKEWALQYFKDQIFPVLTPMAVDKGHPFPLISNSSISLAVSLKNPDDNEDELLFARVKIPSILSSWVRLPRNQKSINLLA